MRRGWVFLCVPVVALGVVAGAASRSAGTSTYVDPANDGTTIDVTSVDVANAGGKVTFAVHVADVPESETSLLRVSINIDTDADPSTGAPGGSHGSEVSLISWGGLEELDQWSGSSWVADPSAGFTSAYANGVATLSMSSKALGGGARFRFFLAAFLEDGSTTPPTLHGSDSVPNGDGTLLFPKAAPAATGTTTTATTTTAPKPAAKQKGKPKPKKKVKPHKK